MASFETLQEAKSPAAQHLRPFCPTRWCLRATSLRSAASNYSMLVTFLEEIDSTNSSDTGAKAHGFVTQLLKCETFFILYLVLLILERVDSVNTSLQETSLHFQEAQRMIFSLNETIQQLRNNGFEDLWKEASAKAEQLNLEEPCLPNVTKASRRTDEGRSVHIFATPMDVHGKLLDEVFNPVTGSLDLRFESDIQEHLTQMEQFVKIQFATGSEMVKSNK